jgi:hypothetical protein
MDTFATPKTKNSAVEEKSPWEGEIDSQIARMTKDADALLDSIREVGSPSPQPRHKYLTPIKHKPVTLTALEAVLERSIIPATDDDDLSDAGTLPDELKAAISREMQQAEVAFAREYSKRNSTDASNSTFSIPATATAFEKPDFLLFSLMIVIWAVVMSLILFAQNNMLDDSGEFVLFDRLLLLPAFRAFK